MRVLLFQRKKCVICGQEYTPTSSAQKYCLECKILAKRQQKTDYMRGYTPTHKQGKMIYDKKRYATYRERENSRCRERRTTHKNEIATSNRMYRSVHPELNHLHKEKRKALKYGNTPLDEMLTESQWKDVLQLYEHRCAYCGEESEHLTIDHVMPLSRGGKHSKDNVAPACMHCNSSKGPRTPEEWFNPVAGI